MISINSIVTQAISNAFDGALSDAVRDFSGSRKGATGEYDPVTGSYGAGSTITYSGRGTFGSYKSYEVKDTQIRITDTKLTVLQAECTGKPTVDDVLVKADDQTQYRVIHSAPDPTDSIWTVQLRGLNVE